MDSTVVIFDVLVEESILLTNSDVSVGRKLRGDVVELTMSDAVGLVHGRKGDTINSFGIPEDIDIDACEWDNAVVVVIKSLFRRMRNLL